MPREHLHTIHADSAPQCALLVIDALERAGFEAWIVGGWVRDSLRGSNPHDVDICTSALWQNTKSILEAAGITVHETGTAHGTVTAVIDGDPIEVTTYREDGKYSDNRHPDQVTFVSDVRDDLARRDFTINAMAWHPERGLLDVFGGTEDLEAGLIRCVGNPEARFKEDALRVLRAIRFATRFGYTIESATQSALDKCYPRLASVAKERIGTELDGIVNSGHLGWALEHEREAMCFVVPSLAPLIGFEQCSPYHCFDIYEHTKRVVEGVELYTGGLTSKHLRWAALLHDIGKPQTFFTDEAGQGHFYGHPREGATMTESYLKELALPHELIQTVVALVRLHDRPMSATLSSELSLLRDLDERNKSQNRATTLSLMHEMLDLRRADALAKSLPCRSYAAELDEHEKLLRTIGHSSACWTITDLAISGNDLIEHGVAPGPELGMLLQNALNAVIAGEVTNSKDALLEYVKHSLNN